jgi:hypothetical protein
MLLWQGSLRLRGQYPTLIARIKLILIVLSQIGIYWLWKDKVQKQNKAVTSGNNKSFLLLPNTPSTWLQSLFSTFKLKQDS